MIKIDLSFFLLFKVMVEIKLVNMEVTLEVITEGKVL